MTSKKCDCIVFDNETKRNRKCKNKFKIIHKDVKYCTTHYNYYIGREAIIIQKYYRRYRQKKLVNKLKELPPEIMNRILFYTKYDLHYSKYLNTISNIVINKIEDFIKRYFSDEEKYLDLKRFIKIISYNTETIDIVNEIYNIFYLIDKYGAIIKTKDRYTERKYQHIYFAKLYISMDYVLYSLQILIFNLEKYLIENVENHFEYKKYIVNFKLVDKNTHYPAYYLYN